MYEWKTTQKQRVSVTFVEVGRTIYCTISVVEHDGKISHYHGGTVFNPADRWNGRTGRFLAFKNALSYRYIDYGMNQLKNYLPIIEWFDYHKHWSHFLAALMDRKVVEDGHNFNTF